jgi:hypothetical protein
MVMHATILAVFSALIIADVGEFVPDPKLLQSQEPAEPKDDEIEQEQRGNSPKKKWKWLSPCLDIEKCRS